MLMRRIVEAVAYLHEQGIVHRDLKPENIILASKHDDADVKLVDFGVATEESGGRKTFCGSMSYVAPEVLLRRASVLGRGTYGKSVDMWSVGVICHVVLSLRPPFDEDEDSKMVCAAPRAAMCTHARHVTKHGRLREVLKFEGPEWARVSSDAKDFVACCLEMTETKRLTAKGALQHAWLKSVVL
jgi:serine/threonine protein kinase